MPIADKEKERQIVIQGRAQGKSDDFIKAAVMRFRERAQSKVPSFSDRYKDITESQLAKSLATLKESEEKRKAGEPIEAFAKKITGGLQGLMAPITGGTGAIVEPGIAKLGKRAMEVTEADLKKRFGEEKGAEMHREGLAKIGGDIQKAEKIYENLPSGVKTALELGGVGLEALGTVEGLGALRKLLTKGVRGSISLAAKGETLFTRPAKSIDEVIDIAEKTLQSVEVGGLDKVSAKQVRQRAESIAPEVSIREKWAGVRPDIKQRIQGKQKKLQEYFDIAHARNVNDTAPTPLEWASKRTTEARDSLKGALNDTGSEIGQFRKSIADNPMPQGAVAEIRDEFAVQLGKLNLELNEAGEIVQMAGRVKKASPSEIKMMQELLGDIETVGSNPTMQNMIELRDAFGSKINFAKEAKDASSIVDPMSRSMRAKIRQLNLDAIPAKQAKLLEDYSDMTELLDELNRFVESRSGGEFLIKRVLSERGRVPREIMQKLKDITGIDLMDDAVMAQLATDIIGNPAQQGLFRQEIMKAGLDANAVLNLVTKKPGAGALQLLLEKGMDKLAPIEKMFLKAAK